MNDQRTTKRPCAAAREAPSRRKRAPRRLLCLMLGAVASVCFFSWIADLFSFGLRPHRHNNWVVAGTMGE